MLLAPEVHSESLRLNVVGTKPEKGVQKLRKKERNGTEALDDFRSKAIELDVP